MAPTTQRPAPSAPQNQPPNGTSPQPTTSGSTGESTVNRKKQKRRLKQAARLAAENPQISGSEHAHDHNLNGHPPTPFSAYEQQSVNKKASENSVDYDASENYEPQDGDDLYYSDEDGHFADNGHTNVSNGKAKKKKKSKSRPESRHDHYSALSHHTLPPSSNSFNPPPPPPPPPPLSTAAVRSAHRVSKDRIWNTSTAEERERIKEFWLSLEEKERRSLVKVEKEAVLKKMKEQQKHSCSCTVCGRKRTAIEEELEVLYDAYYEELEQYANHQQISLDDGTPMIPHSRMYTHPMARIPPNRIPPLMNAPRPAKGRIQELIEDDEEGDEEDYSDEEDDEDYSEEEPEDDEPRGPAADFFNFGNSLTVQGGILTVADDLLKNDGKKFIEMMEQLAERRMQREEEAQYAAAGMRHPSMQGHGHGPPLEEDEYDDDDEEDDDEYDSQEDDEYDEDEMETMTEEQRMEEGRRMFQIFAARMFEQRVLTAYREKVARERQEKLLEELADESRLDAQREAKKAKEAQKKKDKKRQQKQAKEEERAKREAEKAAEEAAAKAIEEAKLEEQRLKKEEQRKKREAEKKALEEERQKKESEKQKKQLEAREQQAELERKQKEQKEKERKKRDETKKKEREEREAKEREIKEKKERELVERKDREAREKSEKELKERPKKDEQAPKQIAHVAPVPVAPLLRNKTSTVAIPTGLQTSSNHASPHLQIAIPVVPKAPSLVRPRQASFQESHQHPPKLAQVPSGSSTTSPSGSHPSQKSTIPSPMSKSIHVIPSNQQSMPSPAVPPIAPPPGMHQQQAFSSMAGSPGMPVSGFPMGYSPMLPGAMPRGPFGHDPSMYNHQGPFSGPQYRGYPTPNGLPFPPGINGRPIMQGRGGPLDVATNQPPIGSGTIGSTPMISPFGNVHGTMPSHSHSHSRNTSASFEKSNFDSTNAIQNNPIARPAPIQRPSSTPHQHDEAGNPKPDVDDLSNHLGSSALLDDTDDPLNNVDDRRGSMALPRSGRLGFGASPMFPDPMGSAKAENFPRGAPGSSTWGGPPMPFGTPTMPNGPSWSTTPVKNGNGFHSLDSVLRQVEHMKAVHEVPVQLQELLDICDTEGNPQNGGGSFKIQNEQPRGIFIKFEPDSQGSVSTRSAGAPGDIGSPVLGSGVLAFGTPRGF